MCDRPTQAFGKVIRFCVMVLILTVLFAGLPLILLNRMLVARPWMFWSIVVVAFGAAVWLSAILIAAVDCALAAKRLNKNDADGAEDGDEVQ